jgi:hypothetical protein
MVEDANRVGVRITPTLSRSVIHRQADSRWCRVASAIVKKSTRDDIIYDHNLAVGARVRMTCTVMTVYYLQEINIGVHLVDQNVRLLLVEHRGDRPRRSSRLITPLPLLLHWKTPMLAVAWKVVLDI